MSSLQFFVEALAGLVDCSGLGKVGVFMTIVFLTVVTSKSTPKVLRSFGRAVTAYQKEVK
jgi:hypothetical protein